MSVRTGAPPPRTRLRVYLIAAVGALIASCLMVWNSSYAAFSGTTSNATNSFAAGTVVLTNNSTGSAVFSVGALTPSTTGTKCVVVTYNGTVNASVKLYGTSYAGDIGPYLNFSVDEGTGTNAACSDFALVTSDFSGTLDGFGTTKVDFASGVGAFSPTGSGQTKTFRFTYSLANNSNAQDRTGSITLTWQAQST